MTTKFKMPEPVACIVETEQGPMVWPIADFDEASTYCEPDEFPEQLYTADALRDVLEQAAQLCDNADCLQNSTFDGAAAAIRAMIKEIPE